MAAASKHVDVKVVMLGASGTGKTSLVQRYINDTFEPTQSTIGAAFSLKSWNSRKMGLWDTAGSEQYSRLTSFYTRGAGAAVVVFDLTSRKSFDDLGTFVELLDAALDGCKVVLVGSKADLVDASPEAREVDTETAREYAKNIDAVYMEASAKTGSNVREIFNRIGYMVFDETPNAEGEAPLVAAARPPSGTVRLTEPAPGDDGARKDKKCC